MERTRNSHVRSLRLSVLGALTLASGALVAACTTPGGGATVAPSAASSPAPASIAPSAAASAAPSTAAAGATVNVSPAGFVTDKDGKTLYLFTRDAAGTSACSGECAASWPPLTVPTAADATAGTGVTGAVATITRDDGSVQVTLAGKPLYYFAGDAAAGDTNGQGLNDVWWLIDGAGEAIQTVDLPGPSASKCGGPACY